MTERIRTKTVQSSISRVGLQALTVQTLGDVFVLLITLQPPNSTYWRPIIHARITQFIPQSNRTFIHHSVISFHDTTARFHQLLPFTFFCRNLWRKSDLFIWSFALKKKTLQRRDDFEFKSHVKRMTERHSGAEINSRYHHLRR